MLFFFSLTNKKLPLSGTLRIALNIYSKRLFMLDRTVSYRLLIVKHCEAPCVLCNHQQLLVQREFNVYARMYNAGYGTLV